MMQGKPAFLYVASGTNFDGGDGSVCLVLRCGMDQQGLPTGARARAVAGGRIQYGLRLRPMTPRRHGVFYVFSFLMNL